MEAQQASQGAAKVETGRIVELQWEARDIGYGIEEGLDTGWFTGEVDWCGKHTFMPVGGSTLYLFADELVEITPLYS